MKLTRKFIVVASAGLMWIAATATPAAAQPQDAAAGGVVITAVNDSFSASTSNGCGTVDFVDYGTWKDGTSRDDFVLVNDYCSDSHGVRAFMTRNNSTWTVYNGLGLAGPPVYWDSWPNIVGGDYIELVVCLVDGAGDTTGDKCGAAARISADG